MEIVGKLHGMPRSLVSDSDPLFVSHFRQELFKLFGTKLRMSFAYHPQSDEQTEVMNRVIEQYLRAFVHHHPSSWGKFIIWAEWLYNTYVHVATGLTPFEITFGKKPLNIPDYLAGTSNIDAMDDFLVNRDAVFAIVRKKLLKAQQAMKKFTDGNRRDVHFQEGDWVLVKLRPRRQVFVTRQGRPKLSKRYYNPFQISKTIGPVAYELALPPESRIHPVFHCSLLKPFHQSDQLTTQAVDLPLQLEDNDPIVTPLTILNTKWVTLDTGPELMVLIQWKGLLPEDTSWESWAQLKEIYHLEDKVLSDGHRDVMKQTIQGTNQNQGTSDKAESTIHSWSKRQITKPHYLRDFVTNPDKGC